MSSLTSARKAGQHDDGDRNFPQPLGNERMTNQPPLTSAAWLSAILLLPASLLGCAAAGDDPSCLSTLEQSMASTLDVAADDPNVTSDPNFTLLLEAEDGRRFTYSHGSATPTTRYESASTSKLVTAVVLLELVDQGALSLDTKAMDLLGFWTEPSVTLRHLLSFTSGFHDEPLCLNGPNAVFESCVQAIYDDNQANGIAAGSQFYYSGTHLQVAGLMAIKATGASDWTAVFDAFKARTGLFANARYDLPSASNPRLAGGMHWDAEEYLTFLRALSSDSLLTPAMQTELFADQRGSATVMASPAFAALGEDWSYGFGNWLECATATQLNTFDCGAGHRNSSAGAYGAYPFVDFDSGFFGMLARQGELGTGFEGVQLFRTIEDTAAAWATETCP